MNDETVLIQEEDGIGIDNPGGIIYVNQNATGTGNGTSWENAYTDLQPALEAAQAEDQIWVAQGTYYPTDDDDRDRSFSIKTGIEVYGGFAGGETELNQRDWINNPVFLSGNIGNLSDRSDNSYHVVTVSDTSFFTVFDGFNIVGGQADSSSTRGNGGAIYARQDGNADLRNLVVANNISDYGGGIYLESSNFNLTNVAFFNNNANISGGGFYASSSIGEINNPLFINNRSASGGAIGTGSVGDDGINIANGTFADNQADSASVIFASSIGTDDNGINVQNSIIGQNAAGNGNLFVVDDDNIAINNSIVQGGFDGTGNNVTDVDPLFINPEGNNYGLQGASAGIDGGNNTVIEGVNNDIANNPRISNNTVDLGAYEIKVTETDGGTTFVPQETGINVVDSSKTIYTEQAEDTVNQNATGERRRFILGKCLYRSTASFRSFSEWRPNLGSTRNISAHR